ncbi:hypothetical protein [Lysinibacillus sp. NPDC056232]|uniref:hypothetical protein n=1 Tax=Lysinibacillus sp. NPDC056232 TaxID=3345756 RepID=UPI0035DCE343
MSFGALWRKGNKDKLVGVFSMGILHKPEDILAINRLYSIIKMKITSYSNLSSDDF